MRRVGWIHPEELLRYELQQSALEGVDVAAIRSRWCEAGFSPAPLGYPESTLPRDKRERVLAQELLAELSSISRPVAAHEPDDWPGIRATLDRSGDEPYQAPLASRVRGAWMGRAIGCVLGKPVEGMPRKGIDEIRQATGRDPLRHYFTAEGLDPQIAARWPWNPTAAPTSLVETLAGTPEDDDINYTLVALRILEQHGSGFTAGDVAWCWLNDMPALRSFTAERIAYRNLLLGLEPPDTASTGNPFREWIGAQIRADLYGWVNPGAPLRAAEWAWRDASVSHTRNGLYGAMFVAAMSSAAIAGGSIDEVLDAGASVIPPQSRMAEAVAFGRRLGASADNPSAAYRQLEQAYGHLHWVHVLNNAALVAYALAASRGDFDMAIGLVVAGGWDTDSNGATVGAISGALAGERGIDGRWLHPLRGKVSSSLPGFDGVGFDELAARTLAVARAVCGAGEGRL